MIAIADSSAPGGIRLPGPRARRRAAPSKPQPPRRRFGHVSGWLDRIVGPYDKLGIRRTLLLCDLFCGAGGFTTGAMRALRELGLEAVMAAVNHWPVAIATHHLNHPHVRHYIEDVKAANPVDIVPERYLDVLLCSPSCVFFSRARGGRPNSDQKRMDPKAILRWLDAIDVRVLICENVPEFRFWCRIDPATNKPIPAEKGKLFRKWIRQIERRGYRVEWRVLTCADYGDPTSRQRWFMIARKDDEPIVWPARSHSQHGGVDDEGRSLLKWRGAAEIIDWEDRGTSIFNRRPRRKGYRAPKGTPKQLRALAYNTLRRVKAGTDRFTGPWAAAFAAAIEDEMEMVLLDAAGLDRPARRPLLTFRWTEDGAARVEPEAAKVVFHPGELIVLPGEEESVIIPAAPDPYLVMMYGTNTFRPVGAPAPAVTAGGQHIALSQAVVRDGGLFAYTCANRTENAPRGVLQPVAPILTGTGGGLWVANPHVHAYTLSQQSCGAPRATSKPVPTVATAGAIALAIPALVSMKGRSTVRSVNHPTPAVTAHAAYLALSQYLVSVNHGDGPSGNYARRIRDIREPVQGLTGSRGLALLDPIVRGALPVEAYTAAFFGSNLGRPNASAPLCNPLGAVTTKARYGLCRPSITSYLVPQFVERAGQAPRLHRIDHPAPAVTSHGAGALVVPLLLRFDNASAGGSCVRGMADPIWTVTGKTGCGLLESYIISPRHSRPGGGPVPRHVALPVPTLTGGGSQVGVVSANAGRQLTLLSEERSDPELGLGGAVAAPARSAGRIIWVDGVLVQIDVAFRMLRNRELARAHSFDEAESTYEFIGTEAEQTKQVGNSVPVCTAQALVLSQIRNIPGVIPIEHARGALDVPEAPVHQLLAAA
ncbi:MAG TPA: DNA cytosine methyltransferase [Longimicrobium sp.]